MSRGWLGAAGASLSVAIAALLAIHPAAALQRELRSKAHNYPNAPVDIRRSQVLMIETFLTPSQMAIPGAKMKQSRVRYANRAGLTPSTFVLKGQLTCRNQFRQPVEAMELSIVLLDAFHQPIMAQGQVEPRIIHRVMTSLPVRAEKVVDWEHQLTSLDVYEIAVILTRVRFADGGMWQAPAEELIAAP